MKSEILKYLQSENILYKILTIFQEQFFKIITENIITLQYKLLLH